jgi:UDP-N-acetylglucosamine acyltransferase
MTTIHPSSIISSKANVGQNVSIGPYCVIGDNVTIDDDVELKSHVVVDGLTHIGSGTKIFPFAAIGLAPQDLKYKGEASKLVIGKNNLIREHVTIHTGTEGGGMLTTIGDNCLLMISVHIAHDCKVGNNVILANNVTLAGHVSVGDYAVIGGLSAAHQFVRIGEHAMIGGMSAIENDVIPYGVAVNDRAYMVGINLVGLKRRGFSRGDIQAIDQAYTILFDNTTGDTIQIRIDNIRNKFATNQAVLTMLEFITTGSDRPICKPKNYYERT